MGDTEDGVKPKRTVFVTVGTTSFDALVRAVDTQDVKDELLKRGYTHLIIQMGRGSYLPTKVISGSDHSIWPFPVLWFIAWFLMKFVVVQRTIGSLLL
jgi:beta-1,4-N-acetylglucosaminyltransferase